VVEDMTAIQDPLLERIVPRLAEAPGVVAVVLGGSRSRGTAIPTSDYDLGLYFGGDTSLDTRRLLKTVRELVDDPAAAEVTDVGAWGPRIVGGGWLSIAGRKVDLLYRGVEPVREVIAECCAGRIRMDYQPGIGDSEKVTRSLTGASSVSLRSLDASGAGFRPWLWRRLEQAGMVSLAIYPRMPGA
jgi:predicted nucleotidyltransferase